VLSERVSAQGAEGVKGASRAKIEIDQNQVGLERRDERNPHGRL